MANTLNSTNNIEVMNSIIGKEISEYEDDTLKKVGKNAFRGCGELSSVTLPSVKSLGEKAFKDCESLEDITVGMNYDGVVSVEDDTFDGCNPVNVIVPKDKVDLYKNSDSWSGFVGTDGVLTVNWGKCGGEEDVIVTYKEGEGFWVPRAFLAQAPMRTDTSGVNATIPDIGYIGKFAYSYPSESSKYVGIVYRLPQNLGEWLYNNSESGDAYGNSIASSAWYGALWNGIAIYPDTLASGASWSSSNAWGVAIRKGSEIGIMKKLSDGSIPTMYTYDITSEPFYQYINADDYYMVAEDDANTNNKYALSGMLDAFGDNTIYFRHWKTMSSAPSATNMGAKYTAPSELIDGFVKNTSKSGTQGSIYGLKDSLTVNWGRCGGNSDVTVTYKKGEGLWIPKEFLAQAYTDNTYTSFKASNLDTSVGYKGFLNYLMVYKLPQALGEYLYNNAEDCKTSNVYKATNVNNARIYKGIAIYSDTLVSGKSWTNSGHWGIGIRKKSDIDVSSWTDGTNLKHNSDISSDEVILPSLEDNAYYLVAQQTSPPSGDDKVLDGQLKTFNTEGSDHIWLRHCMGMTSIPSATNQGEKYTLDDSMYKKATLPLTVNWGKCGGEEDVIVNYDKEEGLWIPKEFLEQGWSSTYSPKADALFLSDGVTKDTSVGYKTWFGWGDKNGVTTRQTIQYSELYITVYKLPQALGEYLYNNAESHISRGPHYIGSSHGSTDNYLYKGIAIYPDTLKTSSGWDNARHFGVGIRKKNDIPIIGLDSDYTPTTSDIGNTSDYSAIYNLSQWKALEDDAYYLVCQGCLKNHVNWNSQIPYFIEEYFDDGNIYFRHWNTLTSAPTSDTSTHGKKYDVPLSLPPDNAKPLGGKIFYIDPTDNGATYTFYDSSGNKIKGTTVSELTSAKYYVKSGESTGDKFYVYYPTKFDSLQWGYDTLIGTGTAVGTGKTNTNIVMSRTDIETGTIWSKLSEIRTSSGLSDLFIPSKNEIDKFRGADLEAWTRSPGGSSLWSSSENDTSAAQRWVSSSKSWVKTYKSARESVFFARSF